MGNLPGKNFTREDFIVKLCVITPLLKDEAEWLLDNHPEMFDTIRELDDLDRSPYCAVNGGGIQRMSVVAYDEYVAKNGEPEATVFRAPELPCVIIVYK